ncbi:GNAT family N-acetyltransferase [Paraburkholderia caffeinilytica]|uniref:GNAT family N-acetyltransferase n=1 Tax=Paraburkholderia caffeinilytica TaxID=1761016 RepID=UPI0038B87D2A
MSVANIEYHVVRSADEAAYKQFMTDLFAEGLAVLPDRGMGPTDEQWTEFFKRRRSDHSVLFIAEHEGRLIGGGGVGRIEQPNREHSVSLALNVSKEYRNQGIGRMLLRHTLRWTSVTPAIERIELEVTANNPGAIHLYQAAGFSVEGIKRGALKKGDLVLDIVQMAIVGSSVRSPKL